jgi:hypothetical protein
VRVTAPATMPGCIAWIDIAQVAGGVAGRSYPG